MRPIAFLAVAIIVALFAGALMVAAPNNAAGQTPPAALTEDVGKAACAACHQENCQSEVAPLGAVSGGFVANSRPEVQSSVTAQTAVTPGRTVIAGSLLIEPADINVTATDLVAGNVQTPGGGPPLKLPTAANTFFVVASTV